MPEKTESELKFEIGHVLLIDIVGYSKLLINEQRERLQELNEIVRQTAQVRATDASGMLLRIPTGDGVALVFRNSAESPVRCALEIGAALKSHPELTVRMGIHSGPVSEVEDVSERTNIAGAGINMAQRVMDCGDAGHILLSKRVADDLTQYRHWKAYLHDLGECVVKHGVKIGLMNLYTDEVGNSATPAKFKEATTSTTSTSIPRPVERKWQVMAGIGLILVAVAVAFLILREKQITPATGSVAPTSAPKTEKSIAILPFANLSEDKANAYFADGVQEEILTTLAKVADLKVISRTSVMQFRDADKRNLRDIAQQLGVAHVLEGSVQRAANRVRVTAQLIDTRTDSHVWADRYDRELADVFAIQSEIAQKIAGQLKAALSPREQAALKSRPTTDTAAYDLYLQAREIYRGGLGGSRDAIEKKVTLLDAAVARDSAFVPALCMLARAHLEAYWYNLDHSPARLERARNALEAAAQLQPDAGEVHLARAVFHYWGSRDYAPALAQLALAGRSLPNDADVLLFIGTIERRQGRWEESIATMARALVLDPRNALLADGQAGNYRALRRYHDERRIRDTVLNWKPDDFGFQILRAEVDLNEKAELGPMQSVLSSDLTATADQNLVASKRWQVALLQRDYRAAEEALSEYRLPDFSFWGFITPRDYFEGRITRGLGDAPRAEAAFLRARDRAAAAVAGRPDDEKALIVLAAIEAKLGRKEEAIREAERAVEMIPVARDALDGPRLLTRLARVCAEVEKTDRALEVLQQAAALPNGPTYGELRLEEDFDPLRKDPRFGKILASVAPNSGSR
jgi:TolB-like protein/Tfp pilus assembly protein PilF